MVHYGLYICYFRVHFMVINVKRKRLHLNEHSYKMVFFSVCRDIHTINLNCLSLFTVINCNSMQSDSPFNVNASHWKLRVIHAWKFIYVCWLWSIYRYLFLTGVCHSLCLIIFFGFVYRMGHFLFLSLNSWSPGSYVKCYPFGWLFRVTGLP